ncbi:uncharacterized protein LOC111211768 [Brassica napus]|uniref:uncharacterized protein LOC111211768 n=1 Tax=Brassica napus TaxID=3708 RepID=UPI00207AD1B4|nr:uncharacterized protein LOC111211768 [Brassica napus]
MKRDISPDILFLMETKNPDSFVAKKMDKLKNRRKELWDQLIDVNAAREAPWFLTGDFNDLLNNAEKDGGVTRSEASFTDLRTFFSEGDLFDLQYSGDFLSWRGKRGDDLVRCRLDRAVANSDWAELFPTARSLYLAFERSDHKPLLSCFEPEKRKQRGLFHYDRRLKNNPEVKDLVAKTWMSGSFRTVTDRISAMRSVLIGWSRQQALNSRARIEEKKFQLDQALTDPINDTELITKVTKELDDAYAAEESYWQKRSRQLWLSLGDRNTGYFHAVSKNRKRINAFSVIENSEGEPVYQEDQIGRVIVDYFQQLFTSMGGDREETVNYALSPMITAETNEELIRIPSALEIKEAVFYVHAHKAPGPDGFSASFFHTNWENIGAEIEKEIQEFFMTDKLPDKINETHIRLISKIQSPKTVAEYRPIALCNVYYKIISKILTKRLQPLLSGFISENQSAFVPGRAISDNVLITHEVLHYLKTSKAEKRVSMAVKTDMSKAYDRLEWDFIKLCVSTVTYSFLINGSPRGRVTPSRGIRQGDPLSPYIFILCSEVLSGLCNKAQEDGTLKGVRVRGCPRLNHLLFADDTMFFLRASKESGEALCRLLKRYEEASGQSINTEKSSINFSRHAPVALKMAVKDALSIQKEGGIGKYLGLPELFGRKKRDLFSSIVDRIKQKACGWSNRFLSTAGKMTMLTSVLSPIPSHAMSCFQLPISLCKRIQSALTRFWWDTNMGNKKMAWIAWSKLVQLKESGGLNFRDIQSFNEAFLAKLSWRLINRPDSLLGRVLFGKYCNSESFLECSEKTAISHGWRGILIGRDIIINSAGWEVGNGSSINIWEKPWLSFSTQLRPMGPPPREFSQLTVSDLMLPDRNEWDIDMIQRVLPFEEQRILAIKPSLTGAPDKLSWLSTDTGDYSTKTGYKAVLSSRSVEDAGSIEECSFDWKKSVWKLQTTPKIKLFIWKALHGALPVSEALKARGINTDGQCKRCNMPESIDHLLFHCSYARQVWESAPVSPSIEYSGSIDLRNNWSSFCSRKSLPPTGVSTGALAPWITWQLWLARNKLVFEGKIITVEETISRASACAQEWISCQDQVKNAKQTIPTRSPLHPECALVRTDAAWSETLKIAGLGWTTRRQERDFPFATTVHHVESPLAAEGLAMREALLKCREIGLSKLRCESDSAILIKAINLRSPLVPVRETHVDELLNAVVGRVGYSYCETGNRMEIVWVDSNL